MFYYKKYANFFYIFYRSSFVRHYEIILMIHPDKGEKISQIIEFYKNIVISKNGKIHRLEDWGKLSLSYMIKKLKKAHYILMNIEVPITCIKYLENHFKFNINIIRHLILLCPVAFKKVSVMLQTQQDNQQEKKFSKTNVNKKIINKSDK